MTFLTELRELDAKATEAPWKLIKNSDGQHIWGEVWATEREEDYQVIHEQWNSYNAELVAYLRNHAKEIINLAEAAEEVYQSLPDSVDPHVAMACAKYLAAKAALEKEQS